MQRGRPLHYKGSTGHHLFLFSNPRWKNFNLICSAKMLLSSSPCFTPRYTPHRTTHLFIIIVFLLRAPLQEDGDWNYKKMECRKKSAECIFPYCLRGESAGKCARHEAEIHDGGSYTHALAATRTWMPTTKH